MCRLHAERRCPDCGGRASWRGGRWVRRDGRAHSCASAIAGAKAARAHAATLPPTWWTPENRRAYKREWQRRKRAQA
jgi:hypothetical protein